MPFFQTNNMTLPEEGPRVVPFTLNMAVNLDNDIDLTEMVNNKFISYISGAWVDNSQNAQELQIEANGSYQVIRIPKNTQAWVPIHAVNPPKFKVSQNAAGGLVTIQFVNFPVFPYVMGQASGGGSGGNVNIAEIGGDPVTGNLPVEIVSPDPLPVIFTEPSYALSDLSIVLDGTNQTLSSAGSTDNYLVVQNNSANPVKINLAGGNSLTVGIILAPGGSLEMCKGVQNNVTISGTNTDVVTAFGG